MRSGKWTDQASAGAAGALIVLTLLACKSKKTEVVTDDPPADSTPAATVAAAPSEVPDTAPPPTAKAKVAAKPKSNCNGFMVNKVCQRTCSSDAECPKGKCTGMFNGQDDDGNQVMNAPVCESDGDDDPPPKNAKPAAASSLHGKPDVIDPSGGGETIRTPDGKINPADGDCGGDYAGPVPTDFKCHKKCSSDDDCHSPNQCLPSNNTKVCKGG